MLPTKTKTF